MRGGPREITGTGAAVGPDTADHQEPRRRIAMAQSEVPQRSFPCSVVRRQKPGHITSGTGQGPESHATRAGGPGELREEPPGDSLVSAIVTRWHDLWRGSRECLLPGGVGCHLVGVVLPGLEVLVGFLGGQASSAESHWTSCQMMPLGSANWQ